MISLSLTTGSTLFYVNSASRRDKKLSSKRRNRKLRIPNQGTEDMGTPNQGTEDMPWDLLTKEQWTWEKLTSHPR